MAIQLGDKLKIAGGYLDESISVENLEGLLLKEPEFYGQSMHMTDAFYGNGETPYPIDFWLVPDSISEYKWEIKTIPALASLEDFDNFKDFIKEFKDKADYYPISKGTKALVDGEEFEFQINENGDINWISTQELFDETITDAVKLAVEEVTSGASEAFDTLKEIEDWIKANTGNTGSLDEEQIANIIESAKSYTDQKISELEIPSTEGLATSGDVENIKTWVNEQGFITKHQDLSDYAKKSEIPSLEGYATSGDVKNAIDLHITMYHTPVESGGTVDPTPTPTPTLKYTEGSGITIDETNKISIKLAEDTKEKENFIEINENNELELNEITLDAAVISEDIEVNGGAWADEIETVFNGKIPRGITFEDFLKKMVKKEKYAGEISTDRNFEVILSGNTPALTTTNGVNVNEKIVEVGTQIKLGEVIPFSTIATQTLSAGIFTYGYKVGKDGDYKNSQLYTKKLTPNFIESASTIQITFTNLSKNLEGTVLVDNIYVSDGSNVNETIAYVKEGYNSITLCQTGDTYSSNTDIDEKIYVATSLNNYTTENGEDNIYELTYPTTSITATNKITYHVTGAKKYYIGGISEYSKDFWSKGNPSEIIRNLELQNWVSGSTIEDSYTFKEGTKQQIVAAPIEYNTVIGTDRIGGPVNFEKVAENINFYNQQGYVSKYNVFVAPAYDGLVANSFINILIEK